MNISLEMRCEYSDYIDNKNKPLKEKYIELEKAIDDVYKMCNWIPWDVALYRSIDLLRIMQLHYISEEKTEVWCMEYFKNKQKKECHTQ